MYTLASKYEATWTLPRHINEYEYEDLSSTDRRKYVSDEGYINDEDDEPSIVDIIAVGASVVDLFESSPTFYGDNNSDDNSFDGFDGGDTGGGGATGDW